MRTNCSCMSGLQKDKTLLFCLALRGAVLRVVLRFELAGSSGFSENNSISPTLRIAVTRLYEWPDSSRRLRSWSVRTPEAKKKQGPDLRPKTPRPSSQRLQQSAVQDQG